MKTITPRTVTITCTDYSIEDFCVVEFQSDSTTGTGKLVKAMRNFEENREIGNNYAFGMNTYNTIKLSYIQMLMKGNVMESWNKHIYWIMQDCVFNNMQKGFLLNFQNNKTDFSHYHIYDLALNNSTDLYELEFKSKYSTSVANLITAFTQIAPNLCEFEKKLKQKLELELGLSVK
jgi:hypothetical protein